MSRQEKVKIKERDRDRLREMKRSEVVKEMLVDEGIIDKKAAQISYSDLFTLMKREDYEQQSHETVPVWCLEKKYYTDLAGKNTPVHRVVTDHIDLFEEELKHKGGRQ